MVHQENAGTHETRITALEMVRGDWVTFLDADDYVVADRYATMLAAANDCDLVWGDVVEERDGKFYYHPFSRAMKRLIPMEGSEILLSMLDSAGYEYEWHVLCSRIYRNDLVRKVLPFLKERHGKFVAEGAFYFTVGMYLRKHPICFNRKHWLFIGMAAVTLLAAFDFCNMRHILVNGLYFRCLSIPFVLAIVWRIVPDAQWPKWLVASAFPVFLMHRCMLCFIQMVHVPRIWPLQVVIVVFVVRG